MIRPENRSCYQYFKDCTEDFGVYDVAESFGNLISRRKFLKDVDSVAGYLDSRGIGRGDVVTIFLPNVVQSFVAFYAVNKIGAIANIVHPLTPANVLEDILQRTDSKAIFVLDILMEKYVPLFRRLGRLVIVCSNSDYVPGYLRGGFKIYERVKTKERVPSANTAHYHTISHLNMIAPTVENHGDEDAVYLHGGGTTGKSKTIRLSSVNLNTLAFKLSLLDSPHAPGAEFALVVLPLFHAFGLGVAFHFSMCAGFTVIGMPQFSPEKANRYIKKYNVTFILGVPNMFKKMYNAGNFDGDHLKKLRLLWVGGDMVAESFLNEFNSRIEKWGGRGKLLRGYGLTEVTSVCTANVAGAYKENSVGRPLAELTVEIWNDKRKKLPPNTIGEIVVSGSTVMNGYFDSEDSGVYTDRHGNRWVLSGDLGYMDEDGYLFFTGRKKRLIIISGYNVYPTDIEEKVTELDYVAEACAVQGYIDGKPIVRLFVTLTEPTDNPDEVCRCIKEYCDNTLTRFSRPTTVELLEKMPRTQMGKIDFMKLTDMPPAPQPTLKEKWEEHRERRAQEKAAEKERREDEKTEQEEREAARKEAEAAEHPEAPDEAEEVTIAEEENGNE